MARLTEAKIKKLLPREKPYDVAIDDRGFRLRVTGNEENPVRTFVLHTRYPGSNNPTRRAIGRHPDVTIDEALAEAVRWRQLIKAGVDPAVAAKERRSELERKRQRAAEEAARVVTIGTLIPPFLKAREEKYSVAWHGEVSRYLNKRLRGLHSFKVNELTRGHIAATLDHVEHESGRNAADNAKKAISSLLSWAIERGHIDANPANGLGKRASGASRERVLNEEELVSIWRALPGGDFGAIVKLLMLTGQRRDEIADLRWDEIDFDKALIDLPGARTKNKQPHLIPLSPEVRIDLKSTASLPRQGVRLRKRQERV